jgi:hypothetical protein
MSHVINASQSHRRRLASVQAVTLSGDVDTLLISANPDANCEAHTDTAVRHNIQRLIMTFDLSPLAGKAIVSATLNLVNRVAPSAGAELQLYRILPANDWVVSEASWNNRKTGTAWAGSAGCSTSGTDYDSIPASTITPPSGGEGTPCPMALTDNGVADLQSMVDGTNRGFLLVTQHDAYIYRGYTFDGASPATLTVTCR